MKDINWDINNLNEDELEAIEFFNLLSKDEARRQAYINGYLSNPQQYLAWLEEEPEGVYNGPVIGIVAAFAFNWVTAGLAIALITLGAGLIQWALSDSSKPAERKGDPRFAETYAGSAGAGTVRLGEPIPAIFCNNILDPSGGVQTPGQLVFSRVQTVRGIQILFARYVISHGLIEAIDLTRTLINDQPINTFIRQPIMTWLPGSDTQIVPTEFDFWCQNLSLSNNNKVNLRLIIENANISGSRINFTEAEFNDKFISIPVGGLYYYDGGGTTQQLFRITNKNNSGGNYYVETSPTLPSGTGALIYAYQEARYQTTKPVNEIELNFSCSVWGRDKENNLTAFAQLFELQFASLNNALSNNFKSVCHLYVYSQNPQRILRGITIIDLPLDTYVIKIIPSGFAGNIPTYELWDFGLENEVSPDFGIAGAVPKLRIDGYLSQLTNEKIYDLISQKQSRVPNCSPQQTTALEVISVNEVEGFPAGINGNMRGIATVQFQAEIGAEINGSLNFTFFVAQGIRTRQLLAAGIADKDSFGSTLYYAAGHGQGTGLGTNDLTIANHSKRKIGKVFNMPNNSTVYSDTDLLLEEGDTWSIFRFYSSCWWPEIYAHLCLEPRFGVSEQIIGDYYLDWINLVEICNWVQGNNEFNQAFAWHGSFSETQSLAQLNEEQARKVMLQPWRGRGLSGFWPYRTPIGAVPIFNASNATDFKIERASNSSPNQIIVVYQEQEQLYIPGSTAGVTIVTQTVTATSHRAYRGLEPIRPQTLKMPECTSRQQAIKAAQIYLNQSRYGVKISSSLKAKTIESLHYYPGSLYRAMTANTTFSDEQSGIVIAVSDNPIREFRIDREFTLVNSTTNYQANSGRGVSDDRIDFLLAGVSNGDLVRNIESGRTSIVTGVSAHELICDPIVPPDTHYEIADLTVSGLVAACFGDENTNRMPQRFSVRYAGDGHIWIQLNDNYLPSIADVVGIGRNELEDLTFQAISLAVELQEADDNKNAELAVSISGINWDKRFFDFSDITIQTRTGTINP